MRVLRQHKDLRECLLREVSIHNPRQEAESILQRHPQAESFVLYKDPRGEHWLVMPVGASHAMKNVGQAARQRFQGLTPVAFARVPRPPTPPAGSNGAGAG